MALPYVDPVARSVSMRNLKAKTCRFSMNSELPNLHAEPRLKTGLLNVVIGAWKGGMQTEQKQKLKINQVLHVSELVRESC
jgi:hypothetical protein